MLNDKIYIFNLIKNFSEPPPPADEEFEVQNNKTVEESTVDLDTRIAMLFNSKSFGGDAPALFGLDEDSSNRDETDKKETKEDIDSKSSESTELNRKLKANLKIEDNESRNDVDMEDGELQEGSESITSSVPSPFETKQTFKNNRKYLKTRRRKRSREKVEKVESGASDISSSEDELLAKGSYSPPLPPSRHNKLKAIKAEDEMSLSSLSSTEPIKEEIGSDLKNFDASAYMSAYNQHMESGGFSSYQNYYYQFQQPNVHWNYDATYGWSAYKDDQMTTDDPHEVAVKKVIEKLIDELKQILKKDINKRMIENTAFKKYEAWWDEQERNKNTPSVINAEVPVASSIPLTALPQAALDPMADAYHPAGNYNNYIIFT